MATISVSLTVKVAWWVHWYIKAVVIACHFTGMQPNMTRFHYWISKGLTVEVGK